MEFIINEKLILKEKKNMTQETFESKAKHLSSIVLDIYKFIHNDGAGRTAANIEKQLCNNFKEWSNKFIDSTVFFSKVQKLHKIGLIKVEEDLVQNVFIFSSVEIESQGIAQK